MRNINLTEFENHAHLLSAMIKVAGHKYEWIVVIARGGMHLGYFLAASLWIRNIQILSIQTPHSNVENYIIHSKPSLQLKNRYLFVDDLIDSGGTLDFILREYSDYKRDFAVQFIHEQYKSKEIEWRKIFHAKSFNEWLNFYYETPFLWC